MWVPTRPLRIKLPHRMFQSPPAEWTHSKVAKKEDAAKMCLGGRRERLSGDAKDGRMATFGATYWSDRKSITPRSGGVKTGEARRLHSGELATEEGGSTGAADRAILDLGLPEDTAETADGDPLHPLEEANQDATFYKQAAETEGNQPRDTAEEAIKNFKETAPEAMR